MGFNCLPPGFAGRVASRRQTAAKHCRAPLSSRAWRPGEQRLLGTRGWGAGEPPRPGGEWQGALGVGLLRNHQALVKSGCGR